MMTDEERENDSSTSPTVNPEPDQRIEHRIMPWRFWFSIALTAFLIVMFGLYLPMRFRHNALTGIHAQMDEMPDMHDTMMGGEHARHGPAMYHEALDVREGPTVFLGFHPPLPIQTGLSTLEFFVNQQPGGTLIPAGDLQLEHTKIMHVIGIRDDMEEFFHIHPQPTSTSGLLTVDHIFSNPGVYKIWSQIKKDGVVHTFGHPETDVQGAGERSQKAVSFDRNVIVGNYQVALKLDEPVSKGHEHDLSFDIHTLTGQEVDVGPYLGSDMHLAVIKDDLKQFIHTHPEGHDVGKQHGAAKLITEANAHGVEEDSVPSGTVDKTINFHIIFPEPGLYKLFAQFRPQGIDLPLDEALTASFWIKVEDKAPVTNPKIMLVTVSLIVIALLSWGVKKFLTIKTPT